MKAATSNYIGGVLIVLISIYYVYTKALHYFDFSLPANNLLANPFRPLLLSHISVGMVAILTDPLQFIPAIRNNYLKWHRTQGKVYLLSVGVGAVVSMYRRQCPL